MNHNRLGLTAALASIAAGTALAFGAGDAGGDDGFPREGKNRDAKDALEGELPPILNVEGWMNVEGDGLKLADLRGKVVVIDFWGTW